MQLYTSLFQPKDCEIYHNFSKIIKEFVDFVLICPCTLSKRSSVLCSHKKMYIGTRVFSRQFESGTNMQNNKILSQNNSANKRSNNSVITRQAFLKILRRDTGLERQEKKARAPHCAKWHSKPQNLFFLCASFTAGFYMLLINPSGSSRVFLAHLLCPLLCFGQDDAIKIIHRGYSCKSSHKTWDCMYTVLVFIEDIPANPVTRLGTLCIQYSYSLTLGLYRWRQDVAQRWAFTLYILRHQSNGA